MCTIPISLHASSKCFANSLLLSVNIPDIFPLTKNINLIKNSFALRDDLLLYTLAYPILLSISTAVITYLFIPPCKYFTMLSIQKNGLFSFIYSSIFTSFTLIFLLPLFLSLFFFIFLTLFTSQYRL